MHDKHSLKYSCHEYAAFSDQRKAKLRDLLRHCIYPISDTLCSQWRSGLVEGSRCSDLCAGERPRAVEPRACQTAHFGKEVVFAAEWTAFGEGGKAREVFVKAASADIAGGDGDGGGLHRAYTVSDDDGRRVYPTMHNFARMVEAYLADNMGIRHVEGGVLER